MEARVASVAIKIQPPPLFWFAKYPFYTAEFKAKVGLEALKDVKTINEIGQAYGVHPVQVGRWKKAIQDQAKQLFEGKRGPKPSAEYQQPEKLFSEIGKLKMEL